MYIGAAIAGLFAVIAAIASFVLVREAIQMRDKSLAVPGGCLTTMALGMVAFAVLLFNVEGDLDITSVDEADGVGCVADVLSREEAGTVNRRSVYHLRLTVQMPGKSRYSAESTSELGVDAKARIDAGDAHYACLVDRDDPGEVQVLWDRPIGAATSSASPKASRN
ncbi:hypothetical protein [Actinomadura hibisca]|uniref:hypothetical protein n=1 Tax=Actinomadura hibisca TaxID=68565 RepID=UPI0008369671|nr:hypothetical protein [Actinomadura hibisca]